jgi:DNA-directed RNA polymerase specialized sigma24 family protein
MSDEELMRCAQAGDRKAFDELHSRHRHGVMKELKARGWREEAEDIAQEVFSRLFKRLLHFRGNFNYWLYKVMLPQTIAEYLRGSPQALTAPEMDYLDAVEYLTADREREPTDKEIADRLYWSLEKVHEVKRKVKEKLEMKSLDEPLEGEDGEHDTIGDTVSGDEPSVEAQAISNILREQFRRRLRALGFEGEAATAMVMHEVGGEEWADIDKILGRRRGYTETRVSRLKKEMRRKLLEEYHQYLGWSAKHAAYERAWKKEKISPLQHVLVKAVWFCGKDLKQVASDIKCHLSIAKNQFRCALEMMGDYISYADYWEALISLGDSLMGGDSNA